MRPELTIDLGAVGANWRALDAMSSAATETAAVVKADGYGLGAGRVGKALAEAGARVFFVAAQQEAAALRKALGPAPEIYVLSQSPGDLPKILAAGARPVLNTLEEAQAAAQAGGGACAVQVETGMNRLGMTAEEQAALAEAEWAKALEVKLVMSHLACADAPQHPLTIAQGAAFRGAAARLQAAFPAAKLSLCATGGTVNHPELHFDMTRPGVGLFGGAPFLGAMPAARLEAPIIRLWKVDRGEASGYGRAWVAARPSRLATIPVGYADGFPRALSNRGAARVNGVTAPFAGRVSMDLIVLDVTQAPEAA